MHEWAPRNGFGGNSEAGYVSQGRTVGKGVWRPDPTPIYSVMSAQSSPQSDSDAPLRDRLADAVAAEAAFDGWSRTALSAASRQLALPVGEAERLFPGGPVQVLAHLSERSDLRTVEDMEKEGVGSLKIR